MKHLGLNSRSALNFLYLFILFYFIFERLGLNFRVSFKLNWPWIVKFTILFFSPQKCMVMNLTRHRYEILNFFFFHFLNLYITCKTHNYTAWYNTFTFIIYLHVHICINFTYKTCVWSYAGTIKCVFVCLTIVLFSYKPTLTY